MTIIVCYFQKRKIDEKRRPMALKRFYCCLLVESFLSLKILCKSCVKCRASDAP